MLPYSGLQKIGKDSSQKKYLKWPVNIYKMFKPFWCKIKTVLICHFSYVKLKKMKNV